MTRTTRLRAYAAAVALVCATAPPAWASGGGDDGGGGHGGGHGGGNGGGRDDRVELRGSCSGRADWKLEVESDDGRLEVEGEVDGSASGQRWTWTMRHNGSVSDRGTARTSGSSGSFEVERRMVDLAGTDTIAFRATRRGQVCRGVVDY